MSAVVIQADREAAAAAARSLEIEWAEADGYFAQLLVQAFASHREAHTAGLVEALQSAIGAMEVLGHPADYGALKKARAALAEHGK